ncbi:MAG: chalcone isomerase family protein [Desulfobacter sp.]|nr:chalcone isomerase family protein [Desulfobacter sp.]WDP84930.1 MAG: chalcone isomerase family protein [Desulfobacter sp.]
MKDKRLIFILVLMAGVLGTGSLHARAAMVDGTRFAQTFETPNERLYLKGTSLLRYLIFIKAYTGALYLPKGVDGSQALGDVPKRLELEYRVAISSDDFAEATRAKIEESVDAALFDRLLPKINALNRLYKNVEPGDRYALTYTPGQGTRLTYNGLALGTIDGSDFAKALFGIWIGANLIDAAFRDDLLGSL